MKTVHAIYREHADPRWFPHPPAGGGHGRLGGWAFFSPVWHSGTAPQPGVGGGVGAPYGAVQGRGLTECGPLMARSEIPARGDPAGRALSHMHPPHAHMHARGATYLTVNNNADILFEALICTQVFSFELITFVVVVSVHKLPVTFVGRIQLTEFVMWCVVIPITIYRKYISGSTNQP